MAAETEAGADGEPLSRRCKAMSASFSVYSAAESNFFRNGSDSGSSSAGVEARGGGGGGGGGVYENFRKELDNQIWVRLNLGENYLEKHATGLDKNDFGVEII